MRSTFKRNNRYGWYDEKDPDATKRFNVNWSKWLLLNGSDVLDTSTWILPAGLTLARQDLGGGYTSIWIGPCDVGVYEVTNRITTEGGLTQDQSFTVVVKNV